MIQFIVLSGEGKIRDATAFRVFLLPKQRLLHHSDGLPCSLPSGKDNAALVPEELRIARKQVRYIAVREEIKERLEETRTLDMIVLPMLQLLPLQPVDQEIQADQEDGEHQQHAQRHKDNPKQRPQPIQ